MVPVPIYLSTNSAKWIIMVPVPPVYIIRSNSIYPAPWWSWCVTACRLRTVSGCASSPHWQSRGSFGVPGHSRPSAARSRAPCAEGAVPHRLCRRGLPPRCPRGLGQGCNAAAAYVARSGWPFTVWANCWRLWCRNRWTIQFFGAALQYCNLPHKQKHTNLQTSHHQPSCLPATSNLNKNINKNTKNIVIFLTNKSTPTFKLLTISHHAFLLRAT